MKFLVQIEFVEYYLFYFIIIHKMYIDYVSSLI